MPAIDSVKIRMYRHGFGDCFLLQYFDGKQREFTMLIDCGLKLNDSVPNITLTDVRDDIVKELKGTDTSKSKPKLDVLVVTHEHWDHVSAFHPSEKLFDNFSIGKIWFAWTENPEDDDAKVLNKSLRKRIKALKIASDKLKKSVKSNAKFFTEIARGQQVLAYRKQFNVELDEVLHFFGPLAATKTPSGISVRDKYKISQDTQDAIDHIRSLARGESGISYFDPGELIEEDSLPGIRIYVLGPPKSKLLTKDSPSKGANKEVYFGGNSSLAGMVDALLTFDDSSKRGSDDSRPFVPTISSFEENEARKDPFFKEYYFQREDLWRTIEDDWMDMAGALAMQMDSDTNNTSLALAIEFIDSGKVLLFPGDAQVGNWLSWHDHEWEVKNGTQNKIINATSLLNNTVFYKAGHHASHNATLKDLGLELMTHKNLVSFVPEKNDQYNGIPFKPLLKELKKKTKGRLLVSADKNFKAEKVLATKPAALSDTEWKAFKSNIKITPLFIEYTVKN
jgi:hypothetical protein